ncbi:MAG: zinc ribbon domain-containing protein [Candidatus Riflebacteria bacterium]
MLNRLMIFILLSGLIFCPGCGKTYRYYSVKARAEEALQARKYEDAKDLYALIYQMEIKAAKVETENVAWAFYRLGVVNELLGEIQLAKGYYWGDSMEEGFYQSQPQIEWFAESGWEWLDQGNPPRSLGTILALEKTRRPREHNNPAFQKKKTVGNLPEKPVKAFPDVLPADRPTRIFNRSLTMPPPSTPEPFRVYY